jgi:death-on-curing protein
MKGTPVWVTRIIIEIIHQEQLREHGGTFGIRDENALEASLARPPRKHDYETPDVAELAAAYAFALTTSHAFTDANKRTAYVTAAVFAELNGWDLHLPDEELETTMVAVATGSCSEAQLATIFRAAMAPLPRDETDASQ